MSEGGKDISVLDPQNREDTFLVAMTQMELQACQGRMLQWCQEQLLVCKRNERELRDAIEIAARNRWRKGTLQKQLQYSLQRHLFLTKCKIAVQEGYAIIPDLPCEVFAIRVPMKSKPTYQLVEGTRYHPPVLQDQKAYNLEEDKGEYVSPKAVPCYHHTEEKGEGDNKYNVRVDYAKDFQPIQFPVVAARVRLMEATEKAFALKVFDEVAIAPPTRKPSDPMIVGRILIPSRDGHAWRRLNFIVAWFLDLETL